MRAACRRSSEVAVAAEGPLTLTSSAVYEEKFFEQVDQGIPFSGHTFHMDGGELLVRADAASRVGQKTAEKIIAGTGLPRGLLIQARRAAAGTGDQVAPETEESQALQTVRGAGFVKYTVNKVDKIK
jgi:hypothetical protein